MPELVIEGERLPCRDSLPPFRLMEFASAMNSKDPMRQMGGMHDFVLAVLLPDEQDRFIAAMRRLDDDEQVMDKLNEAIGTLMESYTARPTGRPSASPSGATSTEPKSRVVSLSRGTAREDATSSTGGTEAAS